MSRWEGREEVKRGGLSEEGSAMLLSFNDQGIVVVMMEIFGSLSMVWPLGSGNYRMGTWVTFL